MIYWLKPNRTAYIVQTAPYFHGQGACYYVTRCKIIEVSADDAQHNPSQVLLLTDCGRRVWRNKKEVQKTPERCAKTTTVQNYKVRPLHEYLDAVAYFRHELR